MEIVCIRAIKIPEYANDLTVGKIYTHIPTIYNDSPSVYYRVVDNNGEIHEYNKQMFMPLDEYRQLQIKKITDDN